MLLIIVTAFMYLGGGLAIFVIVDTFPVFLRIIHGIEILADSLVFGGVIGYLFGTGQETHRNQE